MELSFEDALDLGFFTGSPTAAGAASAGELCFSPGELGPLDAVLAPHAAGEDDAVLPDTLVQGCSRPRCAVWTPATAAPAFSCRHRTVPH